MASVAAWAVILVLLGSIAGAYGSVYIKRGSKKIFVKKTIVNKNVWIGAGLNLIYAVSIFAALKGGEVSAIYPIASTSYIWIAYFSFKHLGEKLNMWKYAGIALIVLGTIFISFGA